MNKMFPKFLSDENIVFHHRTFNNLMAYFAFQEKYIFGIIFRLKKGLKKIELIDSIETSKKNKR